MAKIKGNILGNISGKIGNLSARIRNGETYLSARPSSFKESIHPSHNERKKKFAVAVNISSLLIKDPQLKAVWSEKGNGKTTAFNNIVGANAKLCLSAMPSINVRLTPGGFQLPVDSVTVQSDRLSINISGIDKHTELLTHEKNLGVKVMICLYEPVIENISDGGNDPGPITTDRPMQSTALAVMDIVENDELSAVTFEDTGSTSSNTTNIGEAEKVILPFYDLFMLSSVLNDFDISGTNSFDFILNNYQKQKLTQYQNILTYIAAVTKDAEGNILNYSSTYAKKLLSPVE